jgi:kynurenine formamidase
MITPRTVLILGAGASSHIKYPLGQELKNKLCESIPRIKLNELPKGRWQLDELERFRITLSRSLYGSIDAFLEGHPNFMDLGKYLITRELKQCEDIDRLFSPHDPGWFEVLGRRLVADSENMGGNNQTAIVTFNYDRSLECYLHQIFQYHLGHSAEEAAVRLAAVPLIHVHGVLGDYPATPYKAVATPDELLEISRQIKIIHEIHDAEDKFCSHSFETAHNWLHSAERIIFLGFGFHDDNLRRFRFFTGDSLKDKALDAAIGHIGGMRMIELQSRLDGYGIKFPRPVHYTCDAIFEYVLSLN